MRKEISESPAYHTGLFLKRVYWKDLSESNQHQKVVCKFHKNGFESWYQDLRFEFGSYHLVLNTTNEPVEHVVAFRSV